jgi:hypothetical protein
LPSRRAILRAAGASLALPWLESFPRWNWLDGPEPPVPVRMAFLYMPNGVFAPAWQCVVKEGAKDREREFEWSSTLEPVRAFREDMLVVSGLRNKNSLGGDGHYAKSAPFLTGCKIKQTGGRDIENGVSVDQRAAQALGRATMLPSLELGTDTLWLAEDMGYTTLYGAHISWRDASTPTPKEIVPRLAFDRLFRDYRTRSNPTDRSVLDVVREEAVLLKSRLSRRDASRIDEFFTSIRELELRIDRVAEHPATRGVAASDRPAAGVPGDFDTHVNLMIELLALAFETDTTRIATFMMSHEVSGRNFSFLPGVAGAFHELSHHENKPEKQQAYAKINQYYVSKFGRLLEKLKAAREGDGTLLDRSMVLFGSGIRDGNSHDPNNLPVVVAGRAGGRWKTGRFLDLDARTPLCNLYVSMLNAFGVADAQFGDSTGTLL